MGKYGLFSFQKVDGSMIFFDYWKVLVLNFSEMRNTIFFWAEKLMEMWYLLITENSLFWIFQRWEVRSFFEAKRWWKDDIYWLLRSSCFKLFRDDKKYGLFLIQKVDGKMIFTRSFWAFHDIPGIGKYGFLCNAWHFRCSTVFFPYISPKFNKFLHLRYLTYMFCASFYLLKKFLLVSFIVSIIHYLCGSLKEFLKFNLLYLRLSPNSLYAVLTCVLLDLPQSLISYVYSIFPFFWLSLSFSSFELFNRFYCWLLLFVV